MWRLEKGEASGASNLLVSLGHTEEELSWATREIHCERNHKKSHHVLSKFMILCWAAFTATPGHRRPAGHRLDTAAKSTSMRAVVTDSALHGM